MNALSFPNYVSSSSFFIVQACQNKNAQQSKHDIELRTLEQEFAAATNRLMASSVRVQILEKVRGQMDSFD